ncbi:MAG TPA: TolC family protein [Puia sp.]|jgi:outer membrane protein
MRYLNFFFFFMLLSLSVATVDAQDARGATDPSGTTTIGSTLTVQQAVAIAIKNNLLVNQADIQSQTNKVQYDQAWGNMLPQISGQAQQQIGFGRTLNSYDYTYVNQVQTGNYGLSGNLTLFQGLTLQNNLRGNKYAYNASKLDLQQQKDNITLSVLLAYLQVLSSQDLLAIANEQANIDKKQVDRLAAVNQEGALLLLSNLSDLQGQYAGDQVAIATAVNTLETSKVNLFQLLNVPYKRDVEYERSIANLSITDYQQPSDSIYRIAMSLLPAIKSADLKTRAFQRFLFASKGAYYPSLSFYGGIQTNYYNLASNVFNTTVTPGLPTGDYIVGPTGQLPVLYDKQNSRSEKISWGNQFTDNKSSYVGIQLNVPILNYLRARNNVKQARVNLKNAEINSNNAKLALQQNVELAFQNMIAAYKQYKFYIDQVAAYKESFRTTEIRFNEGVVNSDVYVLAKNNMDRATTNLAAAKYTYIFRTKWLDYYQGKLSW